MKIELIGDIVKGKHIKYVAINPESRNVMFGSILREINNFGIENIIVKISEMLNDEAAKINGIDNDFKVMVWETLAAYLRGKGIPKKIVTLNYKNIPKEKWLNIMQKFDNNIKENSFYAKYVCNKCIIFLNGNEFIFDEYGYIRFIENRDDYSGGNIDYTIDLENWKIIALDMIMQLQDN
jgi:hypothetical protein